MNVKSFYIRPLWIGLMHSNVGFVLGLSIFPSKRMLMIGVAWPNYFPLAICKVV
jgi:hypothetical protein